MGDAQIERDTVSASSGVQTRRFRCFFLKCGSGNWIEIRSKAARPRSRGRLGVSQDQHSRCTGGRRSSAVFVRFLAPLPRPRAAIRGRGSSGTRHLDADSTHQPPSAQPTSTVKGCVRSSKIVRAQSSASSAGCVAAAESGLRWWRRRLTRLRFSCVGFVDASTCVSKPAAARNASAARGRRRSRGARRRLQRGCPGLLEAGGAPGGSGEQ